MNFCKWQCWILLLMTLISPMNYFSYILSFRWAHGGGRVTRITLGQRGTRTYNAKVCRLTKASHISSCLDLEPSYRSIASPSCELESFESLAVFVFLRIKIQGTHRSLLKWEGIWSQGRRSGESYPSHLCWHTNTNLVILIVRDVYLYQSYRAR